MTTRQHDLIMVVDDNFSKEAHFIPTNSMHKTNDIAQIFMKKYLDCMVYQRLSY